MRRNQGLRGISIAALAVLAASVAAAAGDPTAEAARLDEAVRKQKAGDSAAALAEAQAVVDEDPANARAWNVRGWIRLQAGRLDEAEADFAKALEVDARYATALSNRGVVCARRKDEAGALRWFGEALAVDPDHVDTLVQRGRLHLAAKRTADARKDFEHAVREEPKGYEPAANLGWLEQEEGHFVAALKSYAVALAARPNDAWALDARARSLAELGQLDAAIDALDAAAAHGGAFDLKVGARAEAVAREIGVLSGPALRLRRREAETLRHLSFAHEVPLSQVTREAAGRAVTSGMDDDAGADSRRDRTKGLVRLGLVAKTDDVGKARADVRRDQIAGWYDSKQKAFYVIGGEGGAAGKPLDRAVVVHELVHALQDQAFGLEAYRKRSFARRQAGVADEDLEMATRMFTEGDASFVQGEISFSAMGFRDERALTNAVHGAGRFLLVVDPLSLVRMASTFGALAGLDEAQRRRIEAMEPYAIVSEAAPYMTGVGFVSAIHEKGGWDAVARVYADPPRTTEQCIHPERYLGRRDEPTLLPFADLAGPEGWKSVDCRTLGEMNVIVLLRARGADWRTTKAAAQGWDGDLLRTWTDASGRAAIAWATTWDAEADAAEFLAAYRGILASKYPKLADVADVAETKTVPGPDGAPAPVTTFTGARYDCGDGPESHGLAVLRGREVFVVEGLPAAAARKVLDDLLARDVVHVE